MTTVKSGRILVVGGYGAVGSAAASALESRFPGRVVIAGRDAARAARLGGVPVDVGDRAGFGRTLDGLGDVAAAVMCVEPPDEAAARACLERGIGLVDIGATRRLLDGVARLHPLAAAAGATAVLSVGVAPGLTNLLARRAHEEVGGAERIDLTVLLGSGERHGADAVRWTVDHLAAPPAAGPLRTTLPGFGARTAYAFPFSDQYTLPRTLGTPRVATRLCLDSRPLTAVLFGLRRAARRPAVRRVLNGAFRRIHLGGDRFAVRADAHRGGRHCGYALTGRAQSRVTGLVAAHVTAELLGGSLPAGVHHIEELPVFARLPESLARYGVTLHRTASGGGPVRG
ncbi:saccharopine dehydrogenase NADP-binding domain-containing protein [Streptomyces sp. WAC05292]|uniref:saccharopine dehydrogenase NADP-binding domain-containing protein n=1 Tax=Streptomyces sp. WAC05292 TaxID=2487418 RepID=UPI0021AFA590|nr:saccharopine dehydrogenase NADP-binding domain-containing protein [Streptomyces sp. WAC05292]